MDNWEKEVANGKKKVINNFIDEATMQGFECTPIFTMDEVEQFISLKVSDKNEVPILNIEFENYDPIHIFPSIKQSNQSNADLDWLANSIFYLLYTLEES